MNHSYQYTNGVRGEKTATQGQGEDKQNVFGNRASPPASSGDALPSLNNIIPSYQHHGITSYPLRLEDHFCCDADNKKRGVTPHEPTFLVVEANAFHDHPTSANQLDWRRPPFLPLFNANEVD